MEGVAAIYRFFVAHLAPGALALVPLCWLSAEARAMVSNATSTAGTATQGFMLVIGALILGLLVDGICFVTITPVVYVIRQKVLRQKKVTPSPTSVEDLELIDRAYALHYSWMQLYSNSATILLFTCLLVIVGLGPLGRLNALWLLGASVLLVFAAARSAANYEESLAGKWG